MLPVLALLGAAALVLPSAASAQTYPNKPIRMVVANPPGGATDVIVRTLGQPLGQRLGQNIIIDNRPGANGNLSMEVTSKAPADGYTLLYANNSTLVVNPHIYSKLALNPLTDLVPVVTTISNQLVLAVNPKTVPVNDLPGFVAFAKKNSLFYASIGNGSQHHLAMELLKQKAGIDLTHVPYKGGGPASISVMSGDNAAMFGGASVVTHVNSGKLKALAVTEKKGWPTMPELPGIGDFYPGYRVALWHGIFAPPGTPPAILDKLRTEINAVLMLPNIKERLISTGSGEPFITTPSEFAALLRADHNAYGQVIKSIGLKVD
jgi:tripartite-type tricarboxylate transporter receptor subunit TctC